MNEKNSSNKVNTNKVNTKDSVKQDCAMSQDYYVTMQGDYAMVQSEDVSSKSEKELEEYVQTAYNKFIDDIVEAVTNGGRELDLFSFGEVRQEDFAIGMQFVAAVARFGDHSRISVIAKMCVFSIEIKNTISKDELTKEVKLLIRAARNY